MKIVVDKYPKSRYECIFCYVNDDCHAICNIDNNHCHLYDEFWGGDKECGKLITISDVNSVKNKEEI